MSRNSIFQADPRQHQREILGILSRNLAGVTPARYAWNRQGGAQWWLARDESTQTIVGVCGLLPRRFSVAGKLLPAAVAGDFAVDKAFRVFGPALPLQKNLLARLHCLGYTLLYGVPNEHSETLLARIGYRTLGELPKYVKILQLEHLKAVQRLSSRPARWLLKLMNVVVKLGSGEHSFRRLPGWSVATPTRFDERFDRLWSRASSRFEIIGERTASFLNWRYADAPDRQYKIFTVCDPSLELAGYAVYYLQDNQCRIMDLLYREEGLSLHCLLAEFLLFLRRSRVGSAAIRYLGKDSLRRALKKFGFFQHGSSTARVMVYWDPLNVPPPRWREAQTWFFLDGDIDF